MSDAEIAQLYEHIFGTGTVQDAKIDTDVKMLEKKVWELKLCKKWHNFVLKQVLGIDYTCRFC